MRLSKFKTVALSVMVLGLIAGCSSQQTGQTGRMGMSQRAVPVEVKKAATEDFGVKLSLSGRLEATQQVSVTPKASGRVKQIHVSIGDQVKAGQPLVTLDEQEASIQLQRS
ncbi:MAG TPA: biotin/lipoyl-binding protein, partial [Candidatus Bathyarchaeia archaeon]|nr:biotin/lipoyl-binding protein [Candidatus Bathyarchaeia archaeon]